MGTARVEFYNLNVRLSPYPGQKREVVSATTETTSTTATTAGSRIAAPGKGHVLARIVHDEDCYFAWGADPTAINTVPSTSILLKAGVAFECLMKSGEKLSFKEVA